MPKQIVCNKCKGNGYITLTRMFNDYCGIGSKPCEACGGKGYFDIPMTNADRIRAMTDEELAEWALYKAPAIGRGYSDSYLGLIKWLQQPAEGE